MLKLMIISTCTDMNFCFRRHELTFILLSRSLQCMSRVPQHPQNVYASEIVPAAELPEVLERK